jgi:hypothetical protein
MRVRDRTCHAIQRLSLHPLQDAMARAIALRTLALVAAHRAPPGLAHVSCDALGAANAHEASAAAFAAHALFIGGGGSGRGDACGPSAAAALYDKVGALQRCRGLWGHSRVLGRLRMPLHAFSFGGLGGVFMLHGTNG